MAHATADIGLQDYGTALLAGRHQLVADEAVEAGGHDRGPTPHEILCAALCACTAITLRMYAQRKQWPVRSVHVDVSLQLQDHDRLIVRKIRLEGDLDSAQRTRLADIAERTPVTLTLKQGVRITTTLD
jgi:putative redox protein